MIGTLLIGLFILFIVAIMNSLIKFKGVQAVLRGIRPVALGLICA